MSIEKAKVYKYEGVAKENELMAVESFLAPVVRTFEALEAELAQVDVKTKVVTSGFFNPLHKNHISNIVSSKQLDASFLEEHMLLPEVHLTVVVNGDWSTRDKLGGELFMSAEHRADIVRAVKGVDLVFINDMEEHHQGTLIKRKLFDVFTKGGDRDFSSLPQPEQEAIQEADILVVTDVGYDKYEGTDEEVSSSKLREVARGKTL